MCGALLCVVKEGLVSTDELSGRTFDPSTDLKEVLDAEIYWEQ